MPSLADESDFSVVCEQSIAGLTWQDTVETGIEKLSARFSYDEGSGAQRKGKHKLQYWNYDSRAVVQGDSQYKAGDTHVRVLYRHNKIYGLESHTFIKAPSLSISDWPAQYRAYIEARMATVCENSNPKENGSEMSCSLKPEQRLLAKVDKQKSGKQSCTYSLTIGYISKMNTPNEHIYRLSEGLGFR